MIDEDNKTQGVFDLHQIDNFAFEAIERYKRGIMENFDDMDEATALEKIKNMVSLMQGKLEKYFWDRDNKNPRHEIESVVVDNCNFYDIKNELTEKEDINRICFYHLAYSGRGGEMQKHDITHEETRHALDIICDTTLDMYKRGLQKEVLTVGSHTDGIYLYLKLLQQDTARAGKVMELLSINGGNNSGMKISAVDDEGNVHPDQFWWHYSLGNVLERKFSEIWSDSTEPLLHGLRERKKLLKGRCGQCKYLAICNGNLRVRAEAAYGDVWASDPACYLTDEEIGIK